MNFISILVRIILIMLLLVAIVLGAVWFFVVAEDETHDLSFAPKFENQTLIQVKGNDNESVRAVVRKIDALLKRNPPNVQHMFAISHENYFQLTIHRAQTTTKAVTSTTHPPSARHAMWTSQPFIRVRKSTATVTIELHLVSS